MRHRWPSFKNFFAGRAKYPKFKKKGIHDSFTLSNDQFSLDGLHQLTSDLTSRFHAIGIEDLNVAGMVKNRHLSRAVSRYGLL